MTKEQLYQRAAELYRQAVADGADEAQARAKYDAAVARIASMPDVPAPSNGTASAPTAKATQETPRTDYGFGRSLAQGATFGFADEIEAGAKSLLPGRTYDEEVADIRAGKARYEAENPKKAFVGEMVGGLLTSAVPVVGVARVAQGASRARQVAAMMGTGAASSGLSGLGTAEGSIEQRLPRAGQAAAVGAVLAPVVGAAVGKVAESRMARGAANLARRGVNAARGAADDVPEMLPKATEKALRYAGRAFERDRGSLPDVLGTAGEAGDLVFNRGGRSVAMATRVSQAIPSEATDQVPRAIAAQLDDEPGRVIDALSRATGRPLGNADTRMLELSDEAARMARPHYEPMHGQVFGDDPDLDALLSRPSIREAVAQGRRNLADQGWQPAAPRSREFRPTPDAPATPSSTPAAAVPDAPRRVPGQTERGLWPTAKTTSGGTRPLEQVDTEGLLDDLIRRNELERMYYKNTRKYGPNSAVTRRNAEQINRIQDLLMERDGIPFEHLEVATKARRAQLARELGVDQVTARDMERVVHAPPKASAAVPDDVPATAPSVVREAAEEVAPEPSAAFFEELDNAKQILDGDIVDLEDKVAKGIDQGSNTTLLRAKRDARAALIQYLDGNTAGQYADARAVAQRYIGPREAFRAGGKYSSTTSRDALELAQAARNPAERATFAEGVAHRIRDDVERPQDRRNIASRFFGSPWERDKLASVFGDQSPVADALSAAIRRREQATAALVPGQSMTTPLREGVDDFRGGSLVELALQAKSLPRTVLTGLVRQVAQLRGVDEEAAGILGRIMTAEPGSPAALELAAQFQRLQLQRESAQQVGRLLGQAGERAAVNANR